MKLSDRTFPHFLAVIFLSLQFCSTYAVAVDDGECHAVSAPIVLNGGDSLQRVALPLAILQASQSQDLADVRILNAARQVVAFAWVGSENTVALAPRYLTLPQFVWPEPQAANDESDSHNLRVEVKTDGGVVNITRAGNEVKAVSSTPRWLLDLTPLNSQRPDELIVYWKNSEGLVSQALVEASADAQRWQQVGVATLVNVVDNANQDHTIEQRKISLPALEESMRYLRVSFTDGLVLDHIDAKISGSAMPGAMESENFNAQIVDDSMWSLDLGGAIPVRRMQINFAQNNTVLPLEILQKPLYARTQADANWMPVTKTTAYRLSRNGREIVSPAIDIAAPAAREWRFKLDGSAVAMSAPLSINVSWIAPQIIFTAQGEGPFALVAGCANAKPASMDRRTLIPDYRERDEYKLLQATVGAVVFEPASSLRERAPASAEDKRRWILWGVLILATAGLGLLARKLLRELN